MTDPSAGEALDLEAEIARMKAREREILDNPTPENERERWSYFRHSLYDDLPHTGQDYERHAAHLDRWAAYIAHLHTATLSRSTPRPDAALGAVLEKYKALWAESERMDYALRALADDIEGGQGPIFRGAISRRIRAILDASPASEPGNRAVPTGADAKPGSGMEATSATDNRSVHEDARGSKVTTPAGVAGSPEPAQGWRPIERVTFRDISGREREGTVIGEVGPAAAVQFLEDGVFVAWDYAGREVWDGDTLLIHRQYLLPAPPIAAPGETE